MILPRYVVVYCRHFNSGVHGWRLQEVEYYCFSLDYIGAKKTANDWNTYSYGQGLLFIVKYENWLEKGGNKFDNHLPYNEKRYL